jgi:probable DNA metabolism protein
MRYGLNELFSLLEKNASCKRQEALLGFSAEDCVPSQRYESSDIELITAFCSIGFNPSTLSAKARNFYELSVNAFDSFVHAWMSELPIETEIINFGRRVITTAQAACSGAKRGVAEKAAQDSGDVDTLVVLNAASSVRREIHRMMGLLRFLPNSEGEYIAKCEPDFFILPGLREFFSSRFGETAWAVFDEKRGLCLRRRSGEQAKILQICDSAETARDTAPNNDEWEALWKHYHKIINNESRKNIDLQRQFMPKRYWKYLPEM